MSTADDDPWLVATHAFTPLDVSRAFTRDDVAAFDALNAQSCADVLECAFLRSFERALDADALPAWRAACDTPAWFDVARSRDAASASTMDDDDADADADALERWLRLSARATITFTTWVAQARARAETLCATLHQSCSTERGAAFMRAFDEMIGTMCNARGPARLTTILSARYAELARAFDRAVRRRWGDDSDDEGAMEASVLERQMSIEGDIASVRDVMGVDWSEDVAATYEALAGCHASLGRIAEAAVARAMGECVQQHVVRRCSGVFDAARLRPTLRWVRAVPLEFFKTALRCERDFVAIESWRGRLEYTVHEHLGALRIHELFDVVVEYPDSLPAIADLRICLQNTTLHAALVDSFVAATRSRLLHAGASTVDIVQQYIGTIKTLLELDPSGVVLELVSRPVKEYLRERKDTIRCVVTMLTDDGGGDNADGEGALYAELGRLARGESIEIIESSVPAPNPNATMGATDNLDRMDSITAEMVAIAAELGESEELDVGAKQIMSGWDAWEPEPVETEAAASRGRRRTVGDIIGLLVGIYGSKELFINEYRTMLAQKLLTKANYDTEREMHTLELLKLRFGEMSLHNCEVMLKDFADSKRANANIKTAAGASASVKDQRASEILTQSPVEATIVSSLFWPAFSSEVADFKLPNEIQEHMDAYANRYHHLKAPRKMEWKPALGTVVMDITHNDRTFEVSVNPLQASILHYFQTQSVWTANALAQKLSLSIDALRRRIVLWINHGVLVERKDERGVVYSIAEPTDNVDAMADVHADDEHESAVASAEETAAAGMVVYEQYVMGMLTNFPSLPLDRIHNMLKMFVVEPVYDKSINDLEQFLNDLVAKEKLMMEGSSYAKKK